MRLAIAALVSTLALAAACAAAVATSSAPSTSTPSRSAAVLPIQAEDAYYKSAAEAVDVRIAERGIKPAKNVILFIGDGMGVSTITASRIYAGQSAGVDGESFRLAMDTLPWSALSKTYSHDYQVSDSAGTATAMASGLKTKSGFLGISSAANFGNCASVQGAETETLFEIAQRAGLATGLVSTARITHATPASAFAKVPHRNWEADADMRGASSDTCKDIARQLIEGAASDFDVILGGGRSKFLPKETPDPEYADQTGERADGRNLMEDWAAKGGKRVTLFDRAGFDGVDFAADVKVLGLFEPSHMQYELDREADQAGEPSLEEMTRAAITRLSRNDGGFVLMVEGGRIDHAHHAGNAIRALEDTLAFDAAIAAALEMTSSEDTLIIVTADHSHSLTINGYPQRGNPILGIVTAGASAEGGSLGADGMPYTTLSYANGPGACRETGKDADGKPEYDCKRYDLTGVDTMAADFRQQALVPLYSETHAGEDVAAFASGPGANLISGVIEQNEIFHVMGRAIGLVQGPAEK
ncbi:MAG: alkaline phosphatase [Hyphomonas sp.]